MQGQHFYILGVFLMVASQSVGMRPLNQRCKYTTKYRKYTADCVGLDLEEIPNNLSDDIEILAASSNRLRELTNTSLVPYSTLQFLYLSNNFISRIEEGAFNAVPLLEVLDLSLNGLRQLPADLPPPLRKLYLNKNPELERLALSKAFNLQFLSLGECRLTKMLDIGQLPNLLELNLTGNPIAALPAERMAPLCRLKTIYLSGLEVPRNGLTNKEANCQCHEFAYWTNKYTITTTHPFNCTELSEVDHELCLSNRSVWFETRQECLTRTPPFMWSSTSILTIVGISLLCLVTIILCCLWRRSRRKKKAASEEKRNQVKKSTLV